MKENEWLKEGESLEDLEYKGLRILQRAEGYRFTSDSVLLAGFTSARARDKVVDLGTGSGVIATLLAARTGAEVWGVEIQPKLADMARRSAQVNSLDARIHIVESDMREAHKLLGCGFFDVAVSNPPYRIVIGKNAPKPEVSASAEFTEQEICKTEVVITLQEVVLSAARLLKFGGKFYIILKAERLTDLFCTMRSAGLEPKKMVSVQPKPISKVDTVIVLAVKGGHPPLSVETPFVVYNEDGTMTEQTRRLYHK